MFSSSSSGGVVESPFNLPKNKRNRSSQKQTVLNYIRSQSDDEFTNVSCLPFHA
jgi:hypothetical protein